MNKYNFKAGDRVQIRDWEDMLKEFGLDWADDIKTKPYSFTKNMKHLCSKTATISKICDNDNEVALRNWSAESGNTDYYFTLDMLKPAEPSRKVLIKSGCDKCKLYENDVLVDDAVKVVHDNHITLGKPALPDETEKPSKPTITSEIDRLSNEADKALLEWFNALFKPSEPKPPEQPKPEPKQYYCVKTYKHEYTNPRNTCTEDAYVEGKIYTLDDEGWVKCEPSCVSLIGCYPDKLKGYLYPLVQPPAKVGEWVYVSNTGVAPIPTTNGKPEYQNGDLLKIISVEGNGRWFRYADGATECGRCERVLLQSEYLVLDGYQPEQPAPFEMTIAEIEKQLGHSVKVVKESK